MYEVEGLCTYMSQMGVERDGEELVFPKFVEAMNKVKILQRQLQTYKNSTHAFSKYIENYN